MDSINDLLNSISPEDMEKLKSVADSLLNNTDNNSGAGNNAASAPKPADASNANGATDLFMKVASAMNRDNDKTAFLKALRPLLSEERRHKADEAMKFLRLMDALPLLKGMF